MKKMLALVLVAAIMAVAFCLPASAYVGHLNEGGTPVFNGATSNNAFGDLLDWTAIVFGNASNIIDVEGTFAVGGNFDSTRGLSVNGGKDGLNPASTDDVAFLVNGNVNILGYGNVWGQTVVGKADGNTYRLTNVTPSDTTNAQYTVADSTGYFADARNTAYGAKAAVEALPVNGVCEEANGIYTFVGNPDADVLVYNVDDAAISSYRFDFNIAEDQTVIVNFTSSDKIDLKYGAIMINGSLDLDYKRSFSRNLIFNVVNATEMEMTTTDIYGTLLAPNTDLTGTNADICGTTIVNSLTGLGGFEISTGSNDSFIPAVGGSTTIPGENPTVTPDAPSGETVSLRIDVPQKMAVAFEDGSVYYGGEMKEVVYNQEYIFRMCSVNWENGIFDGEENGIAGTVVYRMEVVHRNRFNELAAAAKEDPERYTVKGIDIIDNVAKKIIINGDAKDTHLETDVNNFFMAYRFHFEGQDYNHKTGIDKVVNNPHESLSVNLPLGSTVTCKAFVGNELVDSADVFIVNNSGEGIYDDVFLTSVNDFTWSKAAEEVK